MEATTEDSGAVEVRERAPALATGVDLFFLSFRLPRILRIVRIRRIQTRPKRDFFDVDGPADTSAVPPELRATEPVEAELIKKISSWCSDICDTVRSSVVVSKSFPVDVDELEECWGDDDRWVPGVERVDAILTLCSEVKESLVEADKRLAALKAKLLAGSE